MKLIKDLGYLPGKKGGPQKRRYGIYECECGNQVEALRWNVDSGKQTYCGCHLSPSIEKRIEENSQYITESGCRIWTGMINNKGYGIASIDNKPSRLHRAVYEMEIGEIPKGMHVLHKCDTPSCINANHLFLGTNTDNVKDRVRKGRSATGESHGAAKLKETDIQNIRSSNKPRQELADIYKVTVDTINKISRYATWRQVP